MVSPFLSKLTEIIEANLGNPSFGADDLAKKIGMSHNTLLRRVRSMTGKSINQLIKEIRLRKAFEMMQTDEITVSEVAYKLGFSSPSYFATCFHDYYGYPPGEMRKLFDQNTAGTKPAVSDNLETRNNKVNEKRGKANIRRFMKNVALPWRVLLSVSVVVLLIVTLVTISLNSNQRGLKLLAILPFENLSRDDLTENLCSRLQEQLNNDLWRSRLVQVGSRISSDLYKNPGLVQKIKKELKTDLILSGTITLKNDVFTARLLLWDIKADKLIWAEEYSHPRLKKGNLEIIFSDEILNGLKLILKPGKTPLQDTRNRDSPEVKILVSQADFYSDLFHYQPKNALDLYRKALQIDSMLITANIGLAFNLSNLYSDLDERRDSMVSEGRKAIDRVMRINPSSAEACEQLGLLYFNTGDFMKALRPCSVGLGKDPSSPGILYNLAGIWMGLGEWTEAGDCLNRIIDKDRYSALHIRRLAELYAHLRDYRKAERLFKDVINLKPQNARAIFGLGDVLIKCGGDYRMRGGTREAPIFDGPDSLSYYYQQAMLDIYKGNFTEAIRQLSGWPRVMSPGPPWYVRPRYLVMAEVYGLMKKPDLEWQYYDSTRIFLEGLQRTSEGNRNDPRVTSALGIAYAGLRLPDKAKACAKKTIELLTAQPDHFFGPYAMEDVAYIHVKTGNYIESLEILEKLLSEPGPLTVKLLELDPKWSHLKNLPEFKKNIQKYSIQ